MYDWFTYTTKRQKWHEQMLPQNDGFDTVGRTKTFNGRYKTAHRLRNGGIFAYDDNRPSMGAICQLTGENLATMRSEGFSDDALVNAAWVTVAGRGTGNITRIDYAIDSIHKDAHPNTVYDAWQNGEIKSRLQSVERIETSRKNKETGKPDVAGTVYLGSWKSERFLRVYDKAKELKLLNEILIRVELQTRRDKARSLAIDSCKHGVEVAGRATIRSIAQTDIEWFNKALSGEDINLTTLPKKPSKFAWWLDTQVKSAMHNHKDDELDFIRYWLAKMQHELGIVGTPPTLPDVEGSQIPLGLWGRNEAQRGGKTDQWFNDK